MVVEVKARRTDHARMKITRKLFLGLFLASIATSCRSPVDLQCNGLGLEPREFSDRQDPPMVLQNRYTVPNRPGGINGDCVTLYDSLGFRSQ